MRLTYTLFLALFALPAWSETTLYEIHVDGYPDPERIIDRTLPICFDRSMIKKKDDSLETKNTLQDIIEVCERVAKIKGLTVYPASRGRDCLHVGFEWDVSEAQRSESGSNQTCWRFYNAMFCSARSTSTPLYGKGLKLHFYDNGFAPPRKVLEVQTSMTSDARGFRRNTAEVLCRGAFQDYPKKLKDKIYDVEPTLD